MSLNLMQIPDLLSCYGLEVALFVPNPLPAAPEERTSLTVCVFLNLPFPTTEEIIFFVTEIGNQNDTATGMGAVTSGKVICMK